MDLSSRSPAVVNGAIEPAHREVFFVIIHEPRGYGFCSSTLIGPHTLLTAGHCLSCFDDPFTIRVTNQEHPFDSIGQAFSPSLTTIAATSWRTHPDYTQNCSSGGLPTGPDVGLIQLANAPAVSPRAWADTPNGASVHLVGYGQTSSSGQYGRRRSGADRVTAVTADTLRTAGAPANTCFGDSGGPFLGTPDGGVEQVVGVVSLGDSSCEAGSIAVRVAIATDFIQTTLQEFESGPCLADGVCNDGCTDKANDPDCPESCSGGNLCSATACPSPDPDCALDGSPCISGEQCSGSLCVADPQHVDAYCSRSCSGDGDCGGGLVCEGSVCQHRQRPVVALGGACDPATDACAGNGLCVAVGGGPRVCRAECDIAKDCASRTCLVDAGVVGTAVCDQALIVPDAGQPSRPDAGSGQPQAGSAPSGCSTASSEATPAVLLLALWLFRSVARRRGGERS